MSINGKHIGVVMTTEVTEVYFTSQTTKHVFDTNVAAQVGVVAATLYENIKFWVQKNAANRKHFHEGRYWTYNSHKAFAEQFQYLTKNQVRANLKKLIDADLILSGSYNENPYDRTMWYTCTEFRFIDDSSLESDEDAEKEEDFVSVDFDTTRLQKTHLDVTKNPSRRDKKPTSLIDTDINTDINTDIKPPIVPHDEQSSRTMAGKPAAEPPDCVESQFLSPRRMSQHERALRDHGDAFADFYSHYPKKQGRKAGLLAYAKAIESGSVTHEEIMSGVIRYANACAQEKREARYIKQPATWINGEHWLDEVKITVQSGSMYIGY